MKILLPTLVLTAFLSSHVNADEMKGKRGPNIDQVIISLQLDDATANSLKTLMESHRSDKKALRQKNQKDKEQRHALREQHREALLKVLGYEKMYEFEQIMRQTRSQRKKHNKQ